MDGGVCGANELRGCRPSGKGAEQGEDQKADARSEHTSVGEPTGAFDRGGVSGMPGVRGRGASHPVAPGAGRGKRIDGIVGGVHEKDCRCFDRRVGIELS